MELLFIQWNYTWIYAWIYTQKYFILYTLYTNVYGCFSFCLLICRSNILFNRTNIFKDKTSFRQFLTWLLPGLKKMLILIISNTEGVKVLVCPAIFLDIDG